MKKILGICLLIPLLLLGACNTGGSDGAAATAEATVAAPPTAAATTEVMTETTDISETGGLTDTDSFTDTEEMTDTGVLTGTEEMTGTEGMTDTEEMTGTEGMTGTEEMTGTEGMTGTGSISGAGVTGSTGITGTEGMTETAGVQEAPRQLILASDLQDYNIENAQGDSLGSVNDIVLNLENGQILLVTLEYGGILGIGDKTFPIPLSAFRFDEETADIPVAPAVPGAVVTDTNAITGTDSMTGTDGQMGTDGMTGTMTDTVVVGTRLILDIPEETFENAPGIDGDMNLTDPAIVGDMETFYRDLGEDVIGRPIAETNLDDLTGRVVKLSDLDGANVNNPNDEGVGEIDDILVDLRAGRVEYFILSFGGFLGIGDNLYAIPMDAFSVIPTSAEVEDGQPTLVLDITEEQLENAPVFNADELNSADWDMDAQNFWIQNR